MSFRNLIMNTTAIGLLCTLPACSSVRKDTYYEDRLTRERVIVVFAGDEKALTQAFGQKFKYQYDPKDEPFVIYSANQSYHPYGEDLKIRSQKAFLSSFKKVD